MLRTPDPESPTVAYTLRTPPLLDPAQLAAVVASEAYISEMVDAQHSGPWRLREAAGRETDLHFLRLALSLYLGDLLLDPLSTLLSALHICSL